MVQSRFMSLDRSEWAALRQQTPSTLSEADIEELRGRNVALDLAEIEEVYLPLSRLLNLHVIAAQGLFRATDAFLGKPAQKVPYIIGIAGSVAVGKSTSARILEALLARWPDHPDVALVTTDGFLWPNGELERRGILDRKGFPESYDLRTLVQFLLALKAGQPEASAPIYSHVSYDIVPGERMVLRQPDIVIVEGLNVLQQGRTAPGALSATSVSDFFDFSIYVDADEDDIERWYVERFMSLRKTVFQDSASYFRNYAELSEDDAERVAYDIWGRVNAPNLRENILPTRERADVILEKGTDHGVRAVKLRKL